MKSKPQKKPRLGRVIFDLGYVVDLDNDDMVSHAKDCVYEDIMSAVKYDEVFNYIEVIDAPDAAEADIPGFLLEEEDENTEEPIWPNPQLKQ